MGKWVKEGKKASKACIFQAGIAVAVRVYSHWGTLDSRVEHACWNVPTRGTRDLGYLYTNHHQPWGMLISWYFPLIVCMDRADFYGQRKMWTLTIRSWAASLY